MGMYSHIQCVEPADLEVNTAWLKPVPAEGDAAGAVGPPSLDCYGSGDKIVTLEQFLQDNMHERKFIGYLIPIESCPKSSMEHESSHLRTWLETFRRIMQHHPEVPHIKIHLTIEYNDAAYVVVVTHHCMSIYVDMGHKYDPHVLMWTTTTAGIGQNPAFWDPSPSGAEDEEDDYDSCTFNKTKYLEYVNTWFLANFLLENTFTLNTKSDKWKICGRVRKFC